MSTLTLESPMTVPPDTGRRSVLDLLEDAASGHGTVRFLASDTEATSISTLWAQSGDAARWITDTVGAGSTIAALLSNTRPCAAFLIGAAFQSREQRFGLVESRIVGAGIAAPLPETVVGRALERR